MTHPCPRLSRRHSLLSLAVTAIPLIPASPTHATTRNWIGPHKGFWNTTANWSTSGAPNSVPLAGDDALISLALTSPLSVYLNRSYLPAAPINSLTLNSSNTTPVTLVHDGAFNLHSAALTVASTGTAAYEHSAGASGIANFLIADGGAATGSYTLSGTASLSVTSFNFIGVNGAASFTQTGGTHTSSAAVFIALNPSSTATYSLSAGSLLSTSETVGNGGTGLFSQSGGTHAVSNSLSLASNVDSSASYSLTGGSLSAAITTVGHFGSASFTHASAATHTVANTLYLGRQSGSTGSYSLSGTNASLAVTNNLHVGFSGAGSFRHSAGTNSIGGQLLIGYNPASTGSYSLSATARLSTNETFLGSLGSASFAQSGGTHATNTLYLAYGNGSSAAYTLTGGTLSTDTSFVGVGANSPASFNHSAGNHVANTLGIAIGPGSSASYSLSGTGSLSVSSHLNLGGLNTTGGTGTLSISAGGAASVNGPLRIFPTSSLNLSTGGTLSVGSLDFSSHPENFHWTGGTLRFPTGFSVGPASPFAASLTIPPAATLSTDAAATNAGTLLLSPNSTLAGPGTLTNTGSISLSSATLSAPLVNHGLLSLIAGPSTLTSLTGTGDLYIDPTSSLSLPTPLSQSTLLLRGSLTLGAPSTASTLLFPSLTQGSLDLTNTSLLLTTGAPDAYLGLPAIRQYLSTSQLFSSTPDPTSTHSLGYLQTPSGILIKLTLTGDANLDGQLNADDYTLLDRSLAVSRTNTFWWEGDFNYDGIINHQDCLLLDTAYTKAHGLESVGSLLSHRESQFGRAYVQSLLTSIPEPSLPLSSILFPLSFSFLRPRRAPR